MIPAPERAQEVTLLLRDESPRAQQDLWSLLYQELKTMARQALRHHGRERSKPGATSLVHEACLRLLGTEADWNDRHHFFAVASRLAYRESGRNPEAAGRRATGRPAGRTLARQEPHPLRTPPPDGGRRNRRASPLATGGRAVPTLGPNDAEDKAIWHDPKVYNEGDADKTCIHHHGKRDS